MFIKLNRRCRTARAGVVRAAIVSLAVTAAGCSSDVTRFNFPTFNLTGETSSLPTPPEPIGRSSYDAGGSASYTPPPYAPPPAPYTPPSYSQSSYAPGPTAYAQQPSQAPYGSPAPSYSQPAPRPYVPAAESSGGGAGHWTVSPRGTPISGNTTPPAVAASGDRTIQVQEGDSLYGIAQRYHVSIAELMDRNGLESGGSIRPGQTLVLPPSSSHRSMARRHVPERKAAPAVAAYTPPPTAAPLPRAQPAAPPVASAETSVPGWEGRYTLRNGDSLYGIARQYGVTLAELQRVNNIDDPTKVRAGLVLQVPNRTADAAPPPPNPGALAPTILNGPTQKVAARTDVANDAAGPAHAASGGAMRFRWPARGRIIAAFGRRPDGGQNDGINLAVPQGTEVHAAESGSVAYAGDGLPGYGNLILIRHPNGWVTAYAHNEKMLVKRNDVVQRGQVIATAGKTGSVDQPQLHFELRQGSKPVDPLPHMEK
ncbi:MAG TPA: peptidoglycan DD-metalloendopeptidase family protein [Hyphomicrobiaceae bacterium]|nr:peptidoglycan DD-metalloendopeptidase family protein [Hyphomicrobiaceae bacterium]